ncbi:hypothetical protein [Streptomyces sp. TRM68367]|uniref:hypothetical protein n=1 Tax=Streptomyces sp. TRM68367 TaxID=2758415 RepID=UPI00293422E6|nr:hypothetical protein [Streptomyces sp. TRM68367]
MPDGREVDQAELLDVAKDEDRARSLHRTLRSLSTDPDPKLREMATAVLRGDLTAEQAFTDPEYMAALFSGAAEVRRAGEKRSVAEAGGRFDDWQQERRAEDERERSEQDAQRHVEKTRSVPKHLAGPGRYYGLGGPRPEDRFRHR